ncbi:MAG: hypothetical protein KKB53_07100 [Acidobacteria bacterium]|nr:hypothetical protein [Acidobacteriota bacterium]
MNRKTIDKHYIPLDNYVDAHLIPQLKELVSLYQPLLQPKEIPCRYAYVFKMEGIVK